MAGARWQPGRGRAIPGEMLYSHIRYRVFALIDEHGPLSAAEIVARDPVLGIVSLRRDLLKWLGRGWVARERVLDTARRTYRYTLTEVGRSVLAGDRVARESLDDPNKSARRTVVVEGETMTIEHAAEVLGLKPKTLRARLDRGTPPAEALGPRREALRVEVDGELVTLREAARRAGVSYNCVCRRLAEGRPPELVTAPSYFRPPVNATTIAAALVQAGKPLTLRELATAMGVPWNAVRRPVGVMFAAGTLERARAEKRGGA